MFFIAPISFIHKPIHCSALCHCPFFQSKLHLKPKTSSELAMDIAGDLCDFLYETEEKVLPHFHNIIVISQSNSRIFLMLITFYEGFTQYILTSLFVLFIFRIINILRDEIKFEQK